MGCIIFLHRTARLHHMIQGLGACHSYPYSGQTTQNGKNEKNKVDDRPPPSAAVREEKPKTSPPPTSLVSRHLRTSSTPGLLLPKPNPKLSLCVLRPRTSLAWLFVQLCKFPLTNQLELEGKEEALYRTATCFQLVWPRYV